jgi:hypothetical protein
MENLIKNYLQQYLENPIDFLGLPYVNLDLLNNPIIYHTSNDYDAYFPPLFTLGNYKNGNKRKVVLLSLEPLKKIKTIDDDHLDVNYDFFLQIYFLKNLNRNNVLNRNDYLKLNINLNNYLNYQLNYFETFPNLFLNQGNPLYRDAYDHSYWRYIAHLAKGFLGDDGFYNDLPIRTNGWSSLSDGLIELPIFPMSSPRHPRVLFNKELSELLWQRLNILAPSTIVMLGKSHEREVFDLFNIDDHASQIIHFGNRIIKINEVNFNGLQFRLISGDALASWGSWNNDNGKYGYAYYIGQLAGDN